MTAMAVWSMDTNMTPGTGLATWYSPSSDSHHWTPSLSPFRTLFACSVEGSQSVLSISSRKWLDSVASVKRGESSSSFLPRKKKITAEDWENKDPTSPREDAV